MHVVYHDKLVPQWGFLCGFDNQLRIKSLDIEKCDINSGMKSNVKILPWCNCLHKLLLEIIYTGRTIKSI